MESKWLGDLVHYFPIAHLNEEFLAPAVNNSHNVTTNSKDLHWAQCRSTFSQHREFKATWLKRTMSIHSSLLSCTSFFHIPPCWCVCAGPWIKLWHVWEKCGQHLARWSGHHRFLSRGRSVGGNLDFEQWGSPKARRVRHTTTAVNQLMLSLESTAAWICCCALRQEGVHKGIYSPLEVSVESDKGLIFCRTYQMTKVYACPPSPQYKQVCACKHKHWSKKIQQ